MLKNYVPRDHVTMVRNPHYNWAPSFYGRQGPAALETINWRIIPDDSTRMGTLQTGESDVIEYMIPQDVAKYKANPKYKVLLLNAPGSPRVIMLNTTKPPTNELAVRKAMLYAVDQAAIVNALFKGVYLPAYTPLEPSTLGYDSSLAKKYRYNPNKAKQLLDQAGWKVGSGGMRERNGTQLNPLFINIANDQFDQIAEIVQNYMRQVGINLKLTDESEPTVFSTYNKGSQNLSEIFYWDNDPSLLYALYDSSQIKSGFNWGHYTNHKVDRLLTEAAGVGNVQKRGRLYQQAQEQIMADAVILPIQLKRTVMAFAATFQGMKFTSVTYPLLYAASWRG
jgi:peptide/nickel transport system substrate-binding protein